MFIFNLTGFGSWIAFALAIWFFVAFFRNCNKDKAAAKRAEEEKKRREELMKESRKRDDEWLKNLEARVERSKRIVEESKKLSRHRKYYS